LYFDGEEVAGHSEQTALKPVRQAGKYRKAESRERVTRPKLVVC